MDTIFSLAILSQKGICNLKAGFIKFPLPILKPSIKEKNY
jgi:hypothetical protein